MAMATDDALSTEETRAVYLNVGGRSGGRQYVARVIVDGRPVIVKGYGPTRSWPRTMLRELGHRFLSGKSSHLPEARCATERACLDLWRRCGVEVPRVLDVEAPAGLSRPCLVMEWIEGTSLGELLSRRRSPSGDRSEVAASDSMLELIHRVALDIGRRHEHALVEQEHALIQVHSTVKHVLVSGERLVWIDFESVYRRRHPIERLISIEIAAFLRSLQRFAPAKPVLLHEFLATYPDKQRLRRMRKDLVASTFPPVAPFSALELLLDRHRPATRGGILHFIENWLAVEPNAR